MYKRGVIANVPPTSYNNYKRAHTHNFYYFKTETEKKTMKTATANNFVAIILIIVSSFVSVLHAEELARNTKTKNTPEE